MADEQLMIDDARPIDVLGIGYSAMDYLGIVPRYPDLDEKVELMQFTRQGGGPCATAMVTVARLGGRASYIGKMGNDDFGRFMLGQLRAEGVEVSQVVVEPGAQSQFSFIVVDADTGKRTIYWTRSEIPSLRPEEIRREHIISTKVLHVDGHDFLAAAKAVEWANDAGIPVVFDGGTARSGSELMIDHADYAVVSRRFAAKFTGEEDPEAGARALFGGRRKLSAVTLGDEGCVYVTADGTFCQPAFEVDVVDTTGAGDVFHGALSFGVSKGWPIDRTIEFASAVAAVKCTALGGRTGIPTLAEALEFLRERSGDGFWRDPALTGQDS